MTDQKHSNVSIAEQIKLTKPVYDYAFQLVADRKALAPSVWEDEIPHMTKSIMKDGTLSPVEKAKLFQEVNDLLVPPPEYNLITLPSGLSAVDAYGTFHDPLSAVLMQALEMQAKDVSPYLDRIQAEIKAFPVLDADDRKTVDALKQALAVLENRESIYKAEPEDARDLRIYAVTDPDMVAAREALLATRIEHDEDDTAYQAAESIAEEIEALREEAIPYCRNVEMVGLPKDIVTKFSELRARVQDADLDKATKSASLELLSISSLGSANTPVIVTDAGVFLPTSVAQEEIPLYLSTRYIREANKGIIDEDIPLLEQLLYYRGEIFSLISDKSENKTAARMLIDAVNLTCQNVFSFVQGKMEMVKRSDSTKLDEATKTPYGRDGLKLL